MNQRILAVVTLWLAAIPVAAEEVSLHTASGTLYGTVELPNSPFPRPVVLIIAGSGPTDRDGNSELVVGRNDSLKMLAESLAARGVASLRYDKRGVAASRVAAPSERDLRFEMYVDDAVAWGAQLLADSRFSDLVIAGHSEGSLIAILATQRLPVRRLVSIAGLGRPAGAAIIEQLERQNIPSELMQRAREIIASLEAGAEVGNVPVDLYPLFRPGVQPYLISWFRYDPVKEVAKLSVPILVVHGTTDIQVPVSDAHLLANASSRAWLVVIEGMNHILKNVPNDLDAQARSYSDPSLPINATLVEAITRFVKPLPRQRSVRR